MINYIPQTVSKLIIFLSYLLVLTGCNASTSKHLDSYKQQTFILPDGEELNVYIAESYSQQKQGLSKVQETDFDESMGMIFPEKKMKVRQFWMPETYFDLDVFFMNEDYYILDVHRSLKHYPQKGDRSEVPLSKEVYSQHVLELKSGSKFAKKLRPGILLRLKK